MSQLDDEAVIGPRVRTMQIILAALVMGVLLFLVVAVALRAGGQVPAPPNDVLLPIALGFAALAAVVSVIVPRQIVAGGRRMIARGSSPAGTPTPAAGDTERLCGLYQTQLIVSAALLEGPAFFLLIVYLLQGDVLALAMVGVLLAAMAAKFPTRGRVERFLSEQHDLLAQERMAG